MPDEKQIIIIKRVDDDGHDSHHGGGWKVAYADFMTAMMAFFLLLWILAASDEVKLRGLADYFTPSLSESGGGGDGLLDGIVLGADGVESGTDGPQSEIQLPSFGQENPLAVFDSRLRDSEPRIVVEYEVLPEHQVAEAAADQGSLQAQQEAVENSEHEAVRQAEMDALESKIRDQVADREDLQELIDNLRFDRTPEGLLVQIVDKEGRSMFASGSSQIESRTRDLLRIIAGAVIDLPNQISISGHTDNVPYTDQAGFTNWELSADRANATRRVLVETGVETQRITRISGLADTEPLDVAIPEAAENRRISVLVLYP